MSVRILKQVAICASSIQKRTLSIRSLSGARNLSTETSKNNTENESKDNNECTVFKEEIKSLNEKLLDIKDKYTRALAETENIRNRMQKQIDDSKMFAITSFSKDLLDVADILQKATESIPKEALTGSNQHLMDLHSGLTMTDSQLLKVFTRYGIIAIDPKVGDKFDPNCQEALYRQPLADGASDNTVAAITKIGYKLHERTIRPALVGVFKS